LSQEVTRPGTKELLKYIACETEIQGREICDAVSHLIDKDSLNECFKHAREYLPIFSSGAVKIENLQDEQSVLRLAIQMKDGCIAFLSQLAKCMETKEQVRSINSCIMREYDHRKQLWDLLRLVQRGIMIDFEFTRAKST
jgi:hypothetical protein